MLHAENWLQAQGVSSSQLLQLRDESLAQVAAAVNEALDAPWPEAASAFTDVQDLGAAA